VHAKFQKYLYCISFYKLSNSNDYSLIYMLFAVIVVVAVVLVVVVNYFRVVGINFDDKLSGAVHLMIKSVSPNHGFGQAKFAYGGSILGSGQFTLLPQLPLKTMLSLKVVKYYSKISNSLH